MATVTGTSVSDTLVGSDWAYDTIIGLEGDDIIYNYRGNGATGVVGSGGIAPTYDPNGGWAWQVDDITGGPGDDTYYIGRGFVRFHYSGSDNGNDTFHVGRARTEIRADSDDTIIGLASGFDNDVNVIRGNGYDNVVIAGTDGNDSLVFDRVRISGVDEIRGLDGNDTIVGSNFADTISGGEDNDVLDGGRGNDTLYGDAGNDILDGGSGSDDLHGGPGTDVMTGGWSADDFIWSAGDISFGVPANPAFPEGLVETVDGDPRVSDPPAADLWLRNNVGDGGVVGISEDIPRDGNASAYFSGIDGGSKADFEYFWTPGSGPDGMAGTADDATTLGDLSSLSYEWYRDGDSSAPAHLHPVLRILFDADGNTGTTDDQGYLIFEQIYNGPNLPDDTWNSVDVFNFDGPGDSADMWMVNFGNPSGSVLEIFDRDLGDWMSTPNPNASYPTLSADTLIFGVSVGIGSGWNGSFEGAVDNVAIGFGNVETNWNFELPVDADDPDIITDFRSRQDNLVLDDVLEGYGAGSDIEDFVKAETNFSGDTTVSVNPDGVGQDFTPFVVLQNATLNLDTDVVVV